MSLTAIMAIIIGFALPHAAAAQEHVDPGPHVTTTNPMMLQPMGPAPDWAPTIDPQMLAVVEQLLALGSPPYSELTGAQAREAPNATDAVHALLMKTGTPPTDPALDIDHRVIPGPTPAGVLVRTYTPLEGTGPYPVIVYYHGGGWVIASLDTYDPSARALAKKTGAIVVSVAYRQAPEHKFPAAHEDAFAAYQWVVENASMINGDPSRVAVAGESAGGNLAMAVSLMARDRGLPLPAHIVSVYPIADGDTQSPSYDQYANAKPLSKPLMQWFFDQYLRDPADANSPWISLIDEANLMGLPATTIINAEIDPLRAEGEVLADRLRQAGVEVEQRTFPGVTHEFFGMAAILEQAVQAQEMAATALKEAFQM